MKFSSSHSPASLFFGGVFLHVEIAADSTTDSSSTEYRVVSVAVALLRQAAPTKGDYSETNAPEFTDRYALRVVRSVYPCCI